MHAAFVCVCVFVCVCEREREREGGLERSVNRELAHGAVGAVGEPCVDAIHMELVHAWQHSNLCVCMCVCECESVRERERESEC